MVVAAFIAVISFFQINSYWADTHHFNTGWKVIGGIFSLIAVFGLYKVVKQGGTSNFE